MSTDLGREALRLVPKTDEKQSAKDFKTDQEVRWWFRCSDGRGSRCFTR